MSVPQPDNALSGHCAGVYDNTLYVFGNDGNLQSLPLETNATWSVEDSGQIVNGPACVQAADGLYVIGGASASEEYTGLQRYSFSDKSWETLPQIADVLENRVNHSVAYLQDSQSILVYAGSQEDRPSDLSSQTFVLATQPPYDILSFTSDAPPANRPILVPWNASHAVMAGGQTLSNEIWLFGPGEGWSQLPTDLPESLDSAARAELIDGTDGSKVLQVYNVHTSPNTVRSLVLQEAGGLPASTGRTVGGSPLFKKRRRDLTLSDWPTYNGTAAPTSTRSDCSIVRSEDGFTIMAGGNEDEPIIMFNQGENSWVDANRFFDTKQQIPIQPSSTDQSGSSATATDSAAASSTSHGAGTGGASAHDKMMRVLGITLGVLCGIAAIFILVLLYLRWRKLQAKKKEGYLEEKSMDGAKRDGGRMSFQDRGASFMKEAGVSQQDLALPSNRSQPDRHNAAHSSIAMFAGKWANGNTSHHTAQKASFESTTPLRKDNKFAENHEMMDMGDKSQMPASTLAVPGAAANGTSLDKDTRIERKRSSGWSKYFAANEPTGPKGLSHIPSAYINPSVIKADTTGSQYSRETKYQSQASKIPSSVVVPPLNIDFSKTAEGQRLSHVAIGSPAIMDSREDLARTGSAGVASAGQKGQIVDPRNSQATSINSFDNRSTVSSNVTSEYYNEVHTPWTPMNGEMITRGRATSSVYTDSVYGERKPSRGRSTGFFPGAGTSYKPPKAKLSMSHNAGPSSEWAPPKAPALTSKPTEARDSAAIFAGAHSQAADVELTPPKKPFTGTLMTAADLTPPRAPGMSARPAEARDSTVTVFPGADYLDSPERKPNQQATPGAQQASTHKPTNINDMSWLNLGLNRKPS